VEGEPDFAKILLNDIKYDQVLSKVFGTKLSLISTTTKENSQLMERLADWLEDDHFKSYTGYALKVHPDW